MLRYLLKHCVIIISSRSIFYSFLFYFVYIIRFIIYVVILIYIIISAHLNLYNICMRVRHMHVNHVGRSTFR